MSFIKSILVSTDFSEHAGRAVEFAVNMASELGAEVHLVTVNDDAVLNIQTTSDEFREQAGDKLKTKLQEVVAQHCGDKVSVQQVVLHGGASKEALDYARENNIDLIVIGTLGRSAMANMLLGSVAHNIIKNAEVPVISVR